MNTVAIAGRFTRDPELRYTQTGKAVVNFTVAVNRRTQADPNGADFITCIAWEKTAETIANHFRKGNMIGIEGSIKTGSYTDAEGQKRYTTDVLVAKFTFLETKAQMQQSQSADSHQTAVDRTNQNGQPQSYQQNPQGYPQLEQHADPFEQHAHRVNISDDDLPF